MEIRFDPADSFSDRLRDHVGALCRDGLRGDLGDLILLCGLNMRPLMESGGHGTVVTDRTEGLLTVRFSVFCRLPDPALRLPEKAAGGDGICRTLWEAVYRAAALPEKGDSAPALSDGLLCFGLAHGSGYYWSLADHRVRLSYGEHPRTFDELSDVVPSPAEESLEDLVFTYDDGDFELILRTGPEK